jgi:hypothetical protein
MVSFVYRPVECLSYKFYGINCRPKSSAKLLDRFFHRRRQVSPEVKYLTHRFFDGYYHLLNGNLAVSFQHGLASHFGAAVHGGGWHLVWPADFAKPQYPNGIVSSVSFVHHKHREELGRLRLGRMRMRLLPGSGVSASAPRRPWIRSSQFPPRTTRSAFSPCEFRPTDSAGHRHLRWAATTSWPPWLAYFRCVVTDLAAKVTSPESEQVHLCL